jgi:hypothetical protein
MHDEITNTYKILLEKPEGKRPLGRLGRRWEDNIEMGLRKIGFVGGIRNGLLAVPQTLDCT